MVKHNEKVHITYLKTVMVKYFQITIKLIPWYWHAFFNVEGLDANRILFLCDIFDTNSCEILNKNQFVCPKIHYYLIFIHYLASILKFCTVLAQLCQLEEIIS